jgi:hypothetical protein
VCLLYLIRSWLEGGGGENWAADEAGRGVVMAGGELEERMAPTPRGPPLGTYQGPLGRVAAEERCHLRGLLSSI